MLILKASALQMRMDRGDERLKTEEFDGVAGVFFQTPSPCGYSLLSKRESFIIPPLEEEVDSKNEVF
ncbi:MAG: hypothetical protein E7092_05430 [Bacteroidales bacterium]|nr:hypothetical protein [Bacteroidales bacterium]